MITALILKVVEFDEEMALKVCVCVCVCAGNKKKPQNTIYIVGGNTCISMHAYTYIVYIPSSLSYWSGGINGAKIAIQTVYEYAYFNASLWQLEICL